MYDAEDLTEGFKNASSSQQQLKKWWSRWPDANIGIRTGKESFIAIDIDLPDGPDNMKKLEKTYGNLPKTVNQKTGGGGYQLFFKPPHTRIPCKTGLLGNIDIRGEGGYVVAPPSDHIKNKKYKWRHSPDSIEIAGMPEWLTDLIEKGEKYCDLVHSLKKIPEGKRNDTLAEIAGSLRGEGRELDEIHGVLRKANKNRCTPALEDDEVKKIAESISSYPPNASTSDNKNKNAKTAQFNKFIETFFEKNEILQDTNSGFFYAIINGEGGEQVLDTRSDNFKRHCRSSIRKSSDALISRQDIDLIIDHLEANAVDQNKKGEVSIRIARVDNTIYLDLADEKKQVVKITSEGWTICQETPVHFYRPQGMLPLPVPVEGKGFAKLKHFLPAGKQHKHTCRLILAWLVGALNPQGPYVALILTGPKGSSKSTLTEFLKFLIDPAKATTRALSGNEETLMIYCKNNWLVSFDNLSVLSQPMSDALCRVSTGGGLSKRKQYTDDEEYVFQANRPIIMNGINNFIKADDLVDRSLIIELPFIDDAKRLTKKRLNQEFQEAQPLILGSLLKAVSSALKNENIKIDVPLPRMSDFASWVCAAEEALPWKGKKFLTDYNTHLNKNLSKTYLENPIVYCIKNFLEKCKDKRWEGNATDLVNQLKKAFPEKSAVIPKPNKIQQEIGAFPAALNHFNIKFNKKRTSENRLITLEIK